MPVAIPLVGLAVTAGMGGLQMAQANKQKKAAQKAIDGYKRQDLSNPYGALSVSTLGADRQREDLARTMSSFSNTIAAGGGRLAAATLPNLIEQQNNQEAQIAANLDQQQAQINQMNAGGQMQVQGMQEQRENNDLLGLGQQLSVANQNYANGSNTLAQGLAGFGNAMSAGMLDNISGNNNNYFTSKGYKDSQIQNVLPGAQVSPINTLPNSVSVIPTINQFSSNGKTLFENPAWLLNLGGMYNGFKK